MRTYKLITLFSPPYNKDFSKLLTSVTILQEVMSPVPEHRGKQLCLCISHVGPRTLQMRRLSLRRFPRAPAPPHTAPACPALLTCSWSPRRDPARSSTLSPACRARPGGCPAACAGYPGRPQTGAPGCFWWRPSSGPAPAAAPTWSPTPYSAAPGNAPEPEQEEQWVVTIPFPQEGLRMGLPTTVHPQPGHHRGSAGLRLAEGRSSWGNGLCWKRWSWWQGL